MVPLETKSGYKFEFESYNKYKVKSESQSINLTSSPATTMCYGRERLPSREEVRPGVENENRLLAVENLRDRLADTEERLQRARAREAELSRQLDEMKKFVSVMEILENYLRRQYADQQRRLCSPSSPSSSLLVPAAI